MSNRLLKVSCVLFLSFLSFESFAQSREISETKLNESRLNELEEKRISDERQKEVKPEGMRMQTRSEKSNVKELSVQEKINSIEEKLNYAKTFPDNAKDVSHLEAELKRLKQE